MIPPAKQTAFDNVKSPFLWRHAHNSSSGPKRSRDLDPWILGRSIRWWSKTHGFSLIFWGDEFTWIYLLFWSEHMWTAASPFNSVQFRWARDQCHRVTRTRYRMRTSFVQLPSRGIDPRRQWSMQCDCTENENKNYVKIYNVNLGLMSTMVY